MRCHHVAVQAPVLELLLKQGPTHAVGVVQLARAVIVEHLGKHRRVSGGQDEWYGILLRGYLSKKYSLRIGSKFANASVSLDSLVAGIFFNVVCKEIMFGNI